MRRAGNAPSTSAPTLETERLRLRAHRVEDLPQCAAMWAEEVVTRFIGGKPLTKEETWLRMLRHAGHWSLLGFGYWLVEERVSGTMLGEAWPGRASSRDSAFHSRHAGSGMGFRGSCARQRLRQ